MDSRLRASRGVLRAVLFAVLLGAAGSPRADCFDDAAAYQGIHPLVLRAIAWHESRGRASAVNVNRNGSTDYGIMQINSVHLGELRRYGVSSSDLMQPCTSVFVAAWHLRKKIDKYGNTWQAIGAYHSETPALRDRYARAIARLIAHVPDTGIALPDFAAQASASPPGRSGRDRPR